MFKRKIYHIIILFFLMNINSLAHHETRTACDSFYYDGCQDNVYIIHHPIEYQTEFDFEEQPSIDAKRPSVNHDIPQSTEPTINMSDENIQNTDKEAKQDIKNFKATFPKENLIPHAKTLSNHLKDFKKQMKPVIKVIKSIKTYTIFKNKVAQELTKAGLGLPAKVGTIAYKTLNRLSSSYLETCLSSVQELDPEARLVKIQWGETESSAMQRMINQGYVVWEGVGGTWYYFPSKNNQQFNPKSQVTRLYRGGIKDVNGNPIKESLNGIPDNRPDNFDTKVTINALVNIATDWIDEISFTQTIGEEADIFHQKQN